MSDDEMIATMVKGRELCRQLVRTYESAYAEAEAADMNEPERLEGLTRADRTATRMLACLRQLPGRPTELLADDSRRRYVSRLMAEITVLLDRVMILEREVRNAAFGRSAGTSIAPSPRALRAYGA